MIKMLDGRFVAAAMVAAFSLSAHAAASDAPGFWQTPAVQGYGRVHNLPDSAYQPKPGHIYKVVFSVTSGAKQSDQINAALDRVARTVNLYAAAGVPLKDLKFVAVVSGPATPLVLDDAHYREEFGVPNPNLPEIAALKKSRCRCGRVRTSRR
ncbi:exported protein of unknown function [Pararobbsia alpina]|uniref:hypothetical protein n=1 Tax=Pararobbsia alpina TaxID=621374 RepID=UPI0039A75BBC